MTEFLSKHQGSEKGARDALEVGVKGFGGEFAVQQVAGETVSFVAAGVGITPILPSVATLDFDRVKIVWSVRRVDLPMVLDVLEQRPGLGQSLFVFVTDARGETEEIGRLKQHGASVHLRRIGKSDVDFGAKLDKYYLCTGVPMRKQLMEWLDGKELIFEDFNF